MKRFVLGLICVGLFVACGEDDTTTKNHSHTDLVDVEHDHPDLVPADHYHPPQKTIEVTHDGVDENTGEYTVEAILVVVRGCNNRLPGEIIDLGLVILAVTVDQHYFIGVDSGLNLTSGDGLFYSRLDEDISDWLVTGCIYDQAIEATLIFTAGGFAGQLDVYLIPDSDTSSCYNSANAFEHCSLSWDITGTKLP